MASVARPRAVGRPARQAAAQRPDAGGAGPSLHNSLSRMTTTWPRYRDECEQGYNTCAYTHDCGQHMIEQEGRRLGSGNGAFAADSFPRQPHSSGAGPAELPASELGAQSGKATSRERQREKRLHGGEGSERHGREEKRREHHRSERHLRREAIDPSPPPPPPPEQQPEQPKQAAPTLHTTSNIVNLPISTTAADCVDCAAAQAHVQLQAQAAHNIQALPNGQAGMEVIESINPGNDN